MRLAIPRETHPGENRASVTPETVKKLVRLGADIAIEAGAGAGAGFSERPTPPKVPASKPTATRCWAQPTWCSGCASLTMPRSPS